MDVIDFDELVADWSGTHQLLEALKECPESVFTSEEIISICKPKPAVLDVLLARAPHIWATEDISFAAQVVLKWATVTGDARLEQMASRVHAEDAGELGKLLKHLGTTILCEWKALDGLESVATLVVPCNWREGRFKASIIESLVQKGAKLQEAMVVDGVSDLLSTKVVSSMKVKTNCPLTKSAWRLHLPVKIEGIIGKVVMGFQRGSRHLGCPTANLDVELNFSPAYRKLNACKAEKVTVLKCADAEKTSVWLPVPGVYGGRCQILMPSLEDKVFGCAANAGWCPFYNNAKPTLEVHIFSNNLPAEFYGETVSVEITSFVRPEAKFPNLASLIEGIQCDCMSLSDLWAPLPLTESPGVETAQ